jgi:GlpG protein
MRLIGQLDREETALRFRECLELDGIEVQLRPDGTTWGVWVLDEDLVSRATAELAEFQRSPEAARYVAAASESLQRKQADLQAKLAERRESIAERRRRLAAPWHRTPITFLAVVLCGMATAAVRFGDDRVLTAKLSIAAAATTDPPAPPLAEVRRGEVWRLITPALIHFGSLHLLGNVSWLYLFGRVLEQTRTHSRYLLVLTLLAVVSNLAQYAAAGPAFGGLSGVNCGLFGFLWFKSHFRPESGFHLRPEQTVLFAGWMLICLTGAMGTVASTAPLAGLVLGLLLALPRSVPVFR